VCAAIFASTAQEHNARGFELHFVPELTENLVSDCFGIDEWKALAKAAQ
jgi:hypothetical protein